MARRLKEGCAIAAAAIACVSTFWRLRTIAYRDPIGIPTICAGETRGVTIGDSYTVVQYKEMLGDRLVEFEMGRPACRKAPDAIPAGACVASLSITYNIGNSLLQVPPCSQAQRGDIVEASNDFPKWHTAAGIRLSGLTKRARKSAPFAPNGIPT